MKIDFTPAERAILDEHFDRYLHAVQIIARLKGAPKMAQLAEDRSGLIVNDPAPPASEG